MYRAPNSSALRSDDPIAEATTKGIRVVATLELENMDPYPFSNYKEVVLSEEDTLDIKMAYASYETAL